jgi:CheY-like chemotaxis protein
LGLASVQGEVQQLSGWIEFSSEPGVGSEFCIFLPRAVKPAAEVVRPAAQAPAPAQRGTILLVEPDDRARGVARFILNRQGYHVIEADCAHIAQVLWEGQSGNIDLVVTDTSLGDTSGREFVDGLRATRPDLKVLFTAHPPAEGDENVERCADQAEFAKPYTPDKLLQAVQAAWPTPLQRARVKPAQPAYVV